MGGCGFGVGNLGLSACSAGFTEIHFQTTARSSAPLRTQWICRIVEALKPFAHMGPAHAPAPPTALWVVARTAVASVFVALVRLVGSMLDVLPAAAVIAACPQLRVEGVQNLDVETG